MFFKSKSGKSASANEKTPSRSLGAGQSLFAPALNPMPSHLPLGQPPVQPESDWAASQTPAFTDIPAPPPLQWDPSSDATEPPLVSEQTTPLIPDVVQPDWQPEPETAGTFDWEAMPAEEPVTHFEPDLSDLPETSFSMEPSSDFQVEAPSGPELVFQDFVMTSEPAWQTEESAPSEAFTEAATAPADISSVQEQEAMPPLAWEPLQSSEEVSFSTGNETETGWDVWTAPETSSDVSTPSLPELNMEPGAFLDTVNSQFYPEDPFVDSVSALEGAQAFEEAAQFLFPETATASPDWQPEEPLTLDDSTFLSGLPEVEPFDLGPSYQPQAGHFHDLTASPVEETAVGADTFISPSSPELAPSANEPVDFGLPPLENLQDLSAWDAAASSLPELDHSETLSLDEADMLIPPSSLGIAPSANEPLDFGLPPLENLQDLSAWDAAANNLPELNDGQTLSQADVDLGLPALNGLDDFHLWSNDAGMNPVEELSSSDAVDFGLPELPGLAEGPLSADEELGLPISEGLVAAFENATLYSEHADDQLPLSEVDLSPPPEIEPEPGDFYIPPESLDEDFLFEDEAQPVEALLSPEEAPAAPEPPPEDSLAAFLSEDEDFYASSFTLTEQGDIIPAYEMPPTKEQASPQPVPPPAAPIAEKPAASEPPPQTISPVPSEKPAAAPQAVMSAASIPEMEQPSPPLSFEPISPLQEEAPVHPQDVEQWAPPLGSASPDVTFPEPAQAMPETSASQQATDVTTFDAIDNAEALWHSSPVEIPEPTPEPVPDLAMDQLEILGICQLTPDKRLLLVHSAGQFALMGQVGVDNPNVAVLKIFEGNPIAQQQTFGAAQEGQAGEQSMFVTQVGTWHAIVSTFRDQIILHTELG